MTEVESRARELLRESLGVPADALDKSATLDSLSAWTSLKHIAVVEEVERAVGRRLEVDEILSLTSLEEITNLLRREAGANSSADKDEYASDTLMYSTPNNRI